MQDNIAISVKNLTKVYHLYDKPVDRLKEALHPKRKSYHHDFYALNDVSFEIKKGETVGIIGRNGAGKSTLLKIITGVLTPTSGEVEINGKIASLLELGAGFNPEMSGLENIYLNGTIMGFSKEEMDAKVDAILEFADIGEFIHQPVKMYSSGMFARLAFSVAINVEPDILIVDEALSVGDARFQLKCIQKMKNIQENGTTILYVSHDTYSVRTLCKYAIWLNEGVVKSFGNSTFVINEYVSFLDLTTDVQKIDNINLGDDIKIFINMNPNITVSCLDDLSIKFIVENSKNIDKEVVFVFNIYRKKDNFYICGATSLMDIKKAYILKANSQKEITLNLKQINLLAGVYRIRLAVNDSTGIGILCDVKEALVLTVQDNHEAEGLITIERNWKL